MSEEHDWLERMRADETPPPPLPPEIHAADALLAAIEEGHETFETADEDLLDVAIKRHGMAAVNEALEEGARVRREGDEPAGEVLGGPSWFGRPAVQAGLLAAAAAIAVVLIRQPTSGAPVGPGPLEVAWRDFTPPAPTTAPVLMPETTPRVAASGWDQTLRGAGDPGVLALLNHLAILHTKDTFGSATLLDTAGWLAASSDFVAHALQRAAFRGESATLEVQLLETTTSDPIQAQPSGPRRTAQVMSHRPDLGLALLRLNDVQSLGQRGPELAEAPPKPGSDVLLASPSAMGGAMVLSKRLSRTPSLDSDFLQLTEPDIVPGTQGSPLFEQAPPRGLVGILLPPEIRGRVRAASTSSLQTLLSARPEGALTYPLDPFLAPSGSSRWISDLAQPVEGGPFTTLVTTKATAGESIQLLLFSETAIEAATVPTSGFTAPTAGRFPCDVFLARYPDGAVAMGRSGEDHLLERVVLQRADAEAPLLLWKVRPNSGDWVRTEHRGTAAEDLLELESEYLQAIEAATQEASAK